MQPYVVLFWAFGFRIVLHCLMSTISFFACRLLFLLCMRVYTCMCVCIRGYVCVRNVLSLASSATTTHCPSLSPYMICTYVQPLFTIIYLCLCMEVRAFCFVMLCYA
eukprot:Rmarinus@m.16135